jgi:serine/threonine protein kinase
MAKEQHRVGPLAGGSPPNVQVDPDLTRYGDTGSARGACVEDSGETVAAGAGAPSKRDRAAGGLQLALGERLSGRYRIERVLGEGGMGVVYLARDEQVAGEIFAIKVLKEGLQSGALEALREEVRKTRRLSHPNIVDVHLVSVDGQKLYVLMEHLEGKSLDELLHEEFGRGMPFSRACPIIEDVGAALGYAHDHNVIHSDVKPANVFVTSAGKSKLLDFGIARVSRAPLKGARSETLALTRLYASCEMLEGKEADRRDDIYSFACVIYEMLSGERPFGESTAIEAREAGARMLPLGILTRDQNAALLKALSFNREARTSSVEKLLDGLAANPQKKGWAAPDWPLLRRLPGLVSSDPSSDKAVAQLLDTGYGSNAAPQDLWPHTSPYRGLAAMTVRDSQFFFGRERETAEVVDALATTRDKVIVLLGNSGVGKSSLVQAGVLAALLRQAWPQGMTAKPWPALFHDSREWCFVTFRPGAEPVRSLVTAFLDTWQLDTISIELPERRTEWVDALLAGRLGLRDLLDQTTRRYEDQGLSVPTTFLIYIDQGEELYTRADERERRRFSELIARGLDDSRTRALMSLRADFYGELQKDEALYDVHRPISVAPLRQAQLREVVTRPAELLSVPFDPPDLGSSISARAAEESAKDAGALPLLSYLLEDMWSEMVRRGDGVLRLSGNVIDLGAVLVDRADVFLTSHSESEETVRRIFTLRLATVREDGEPIRRCAMRSEFTDDEWLLVSDLADHPNRLLVTGKSQAGEAYAEVAHETIFKHWKKLRDWIVGEREFLSWRTGLETARRTWQSTAADSRSETLLMGAALTQAQNWLIKRGEDLPLDREFIEQSIERWRRAKRRARLVETLAFALLISIIMGLFAWLNEASIHDRWRWFTQIHPYMQAHVRPFVLSASAEHRLKPGDTFKECDGQCPEMVVVPAGDFVMGSPKDEHGHHKNEDPQHKVVFRRQLAVSKYPRLSPTGMPVSPTAIATHMLRIRTLEEGGGP